MDAQTALNSDPALAAINQSGQAEQKLAGQEQKEMAPLVNQSQGIMAQPRPQRPQLAAAPAPPSENSETTKKMKDEANVFMAASTAMAALLGVFAKGHATTALNAFSGAMQGFHQGNLEKAAEEHKKFEDATKKVKQDNDALLAEYAAVMDDRKASIEDLGHQMQMIAIKYKDPLMAQAAATRNIQEMARIYEQKADRGQRYDLAVRQMNQTYELHQESMREKIDTMKIDTIGGMKWLMQQPPELQAKIKEGWAFTHPGKTNPMEEKATESALDMDAMKLLVTGKYPPYSKDSTVNRKIENRAVDLAKSAGLSYAEMATLPQEKKADAVALAADVKWFDGIKRGQKNMDLQLNLAKEYFDKLPLTEIRAINAGLMKGMTNFGGADANNYANAMTGVAMEWGRLEAGPQSAAMLPVEVLKVGMERFVNVTPDQFRGELDLLPREAANKTQTMETVIEERRTALRSFGNETPKAPVAAGGKSFADEAAAQAAVNAGAVKAGDVVTIGGKKMRWED